ncbi:DUF2637 domain-containing protein [Streptomyces sp. NPDC093589]|uniref:DUF2637 domain-containing protein n=1 Tax=Streptomyces sp. NPDC093589 TaxID=3366043 RepID=UPI00380F239A
MTHATTTVPLTIAPVGTWDRLAIVALGAAGCALSYDALQQMAVAIHVRGWLTYLFPLVVDGFIAYGVRALLVLSAAPLRARAYVWLLFGTATTASIWANALHAVRLNQQTAQDGLRLGDTVVAVLSTLAPLALAGAVHLYILITRHHPRTADLETVEPHGDHTSVPVPEPSDKWDRATRWLRSVPDTDSVPGPHWDSSWTGDRPDGTGQGRPDGPRPASGGDQLPVPNTPWDRHDAEKAGPTSGTEGTGGTATRGRGEPAPPTDQDQQRRTVPVPGNSPDSGTATGEHAHIQGAPETVPSVSHDVRHPAADAVPGTDTSNNHSAPVPGTKADGPGPPSLSDSGDRDQNEAVPGTVEGEPHQAPCKGDGLDPVPDDEARRGGDPVPEKEGTGDGSEATPPADGGRPERGGRKRSRLSEDEIVERIRPHVPAALQRDKNSEVTRVQLREIMRAQRISIRNDRLSPVLQRLRSETGSNTTRSTAR